MFSLTFLFYISALIEPEVIITPEIKFSNKGINLKYLFEFIESYGGLECFRDQSTEDVYNSFIAPLCSDNVYVSFSQSIQESSQDVVGPSVWYICQSWQYNFIDTINAIQNRLLTIYGEDNANNVYIWWDIFSAPIIINNDPKLGFWTEQISTEISSTIGHVMIIILNWNTSNTTNSTNTITNIPYCFQDMKCLLELCYTIYNNLEIEISMTTSEWIEFDQCISQDKQVFYTYIIYQINTQYGMIIKSSDGADLSLPKPLHTLTNTSNTTDIAAKDNSSDIITIADNSVEAWKYAIITCIHNICSSSTNTTSTTTNFIHTVIHTIFEDWFILYIQDKVEYILLLYPIDTNMTTDIALDILKYRKILIHIYYTKGQNYDKLCYLYQENLNFSILILGEYHNESIYYTNQLAIFFRSLGQYKRAETHFLARLSKRRYILRDDHPMTLSAMYDLAYLYRCMERYDDAEQLYIAVLDIRIRVLGTQHVDTISSLHELSELYRATNQHDLVTSLLNSRVNTNIHAYGSDNQVTIDSKIIQADAFFSNLQ